MRAVPREIGESVACAKREMDVEPWFNRMRHGVIDLIQNRKVLRAGITEIRRDQRHRTLTNIEIAAMESLRQCPRDWL